MTDLDAVLAAVIAEPDVDLHRHAYADCCDDLGDHARAEYVRWALRELTLGRN